MSAVWAVVPAAGVGRRLGTDIPKQYLPLLGRPVLERSVSALLAHPRVAGAVVVLNGADPYADDLQALWTRRGVYRADGGAERQDSVLNGLARLRDGLADAGDTVLVHDAVRPCLAMEDLEALLTAGMECPEGALLASPVRDTLKREGDDGRVHETVCRSNLWHALTPQHFPLQALYAALSACARDRVAVTDESQAMEQAGFRPRLVGCTRLNPKITLPGDLDLAELILRGRAGAASANHE